MKTLIIEDEQELREFLAISLERAGFIVDETGDGEEGSFLARTNEYDVVILDHLLKGKDGHEITKDIRAAGKNTSIIMMSIKTEVQHKVKVFESGIDDYITKPFSVSELVARIKARARRSYEIKPEILTIDDLTIDSRKQSVRKKNKEIYMTRKEFSLLECLAKEKGNVVTRGEIIERVWDRNVDPFSNTIETHIRNIRRKIKDSKQKVIQTIPGRGYKINS